MAKYNDNTAPIFKKLNILCMEDLIELELVKLSFQFVKNKLPPPIMALFIPNAYHNYKNIIFSACTFSSY